MTSLAYICDLDSDTGATLKVYLFRNVKNIDDVRDNVVKGLWKCTAIKPSLIVDMLQLAVAANRAVLAEKTHSMVTRSVYTEILFNLSLSNNISQSLTKFGIEKEHSLLVSFLVRSEEDSSEEVLNKIVGEMCPISDLQKFTNINDVNSVYKLKNLKCNNELLDVIVSKMVTKNFVSH